MNDLLALKAKGYSRPKLAAHFGVSEKTIQRELQKDPVNQFANKLAKLVNDAPEGYCRQELNRMIWEIRTFRTSNIEEKKLKILSAIRSEAREVEEIAEDCNLSQTETLDLLKDLETERKIFKRVRRRNFHYFLFVPT